jgi:hypothetical protein
VVILLILCTLSGIHPALGVIVAPAIMYFVGVGLYKLVINKVVIEICLSQY